MGSFVAKGCRDLADALPEVNSMRAHDGLDPVALADLADWISEGNATLEAIPENV